MQENSEFRICTNVCFRLENRLWYTNFYLYKKSTNENAEKNDFRALKPGPLQQSQTGWNREIQEYIESVCFEARDRIGF